MLLNSPISFCLGRQVDGLPQPGLKEFGSQINITLILMLPLFLRIPSFYYSTESQCYCLPVANAGTHG